MMIKSSCNFRLKSRHRFRLKSRHRFRLKSRHSICLKPRYSICLKQSGFTLLEVLIALSIFAILGLASYRLLSGELQTQARLELQSERYNSWQRGIYRLTADLRQVIDRPVRGQYGLLEPALVGMDDQLLFTRSGWDNPLLQRRSQLQRVRLVLSSGDEGTDNTDSYLARAFWPALDRGPTLEPIEQRLLPGVERLEFRYLDGETREWLRQWPPQSSSNLRSTSLPLAIEVVLESPVLGRISRTLVLQQGQPEEAS